MQNPIYLDYAATTPVDPLVADKMMQYLTPQGVFGNPSSTHVVGYAAKHAVEVGREQVADLISADASEIIWTSGATEADNLAIKGAAFLHQRRGKHIITLKTEHAAVLDSCQYLEKQGFFVTYLTPHQNGLMDLDALREAIRADTILVSVMHVNNETGVIQNIHDIASVTSERGILFHVDAAQSAGKIAIDVQHSPIDLLSLSAHKVYGPKGIGALYLRRKPRVKVGALLHGGGHEQGMRPGTLPTHQIVGMGEAFVLAKSNRVADYEKCRQLKNTFWQQISSALPEVFMHSDMLHTVPHILSVCIPGVRSEKLMMSLPDVALSAGSACHAKNGEASSVLRAMGVSTEDALSTLRFSFGRFTTLDEVEVAAKLVVAAVRKQR